MTIDIDGLTRDELMDLNHRIVARIKFMDQAFAHSQMLRFSVGDRVSFRHSTRGLISGRLTRYNSKTVTVISDDGEQWNVPPSMIRRIEDVTPKGTAISTVRQG